MTEVVRAALGRGGLVVSAEEAAAVKERCCYVAPQREQEVLVGGGGDVVLVLESGRALAVPDVVRRGVPEVLFGDNEGAWGVRTGGCKEGRRGEGVAAVGSLALGKTARPVCHGHGRPRCSRLTNRLQRRRRRRRWQSAPPSTPILHCRGR